MKTKFDYTFKYENFVQEYQQHVNKVYAQREEILEAFVAKYGYEPDRIVQVIQRTVDGEKFFVRLRTDEEIEMLKNISKAP